MHKDSRSRAEERRKSMSSVWRMCDSRERRVEGSEKEGLQRGERLRWRESRPVNGALGRGGERVAVVWVWILWVDVSFETLWDRRKDMISPMEVPPSCAQAQRPLKGRHTSSSPTSHP